MLQDSCEWPSSRPLILHEASFEQAAYRAGGRWHRESATRKLGFVRFANVMHGSPKRSGGSTSSTSHRLECFRFSHRCWSRMSGLSSTTRWEGGRRRERVGRRVVACRCRICFSFSTVCELVVRRCHVGGGSRRARSLHASGETRWT